MLVNNMLLGRPLDETALSEKRATLTLQIEANLGDARSTRTFDLPKWREAALDARDGLTALLAYEHAMRTANAAFLETARIWNRGEVFDFVAAAKRAAEKNETL